MEDEEEEENEEGGEEDGETREEGGGKAQRPREAAERGEKERKKKKARKPPPVRSVCDYTAYLPPDWLKATSLHPSPYFPQVGDLVRPISHSLMYESKGRGWEPRIFLLLAETLGKDRPTNTSTKVCSATYCRATAVFSFLPTGSLFSSRSRTLHEGREGGEAMSMETTEDAMATLPPEAPGIVSGEECSFRGRPTHSLLHKSW